MVDPLTTRRIAHRALFVALAAVILFLRLLPVNAAAHGIPGPDLTLAFTFVWVLRRPDYVPAVLVVAVFLMEDLMFWRPVGLWTLIVLAATEFLRAREESSRDLPFVLEMALVMGVMSTMLIANRLILGLAMVEQPLLGLELLRLVVTLAAYPFVVALSKLGFGLRRAAPGEVDALGHRL